MAIDFVAAGALAGTVTLPQLSLVAPTCVANDILIAAINAKDNQQWTAPSGWTIFAEGNNTTAQRVTLAWKRAVTADSDATFIFTVPVDNNITYHGMISAWRGCITTATPIDAATPNLQVSGAFDSVSYDLAGTFDPVSVPAYVVAIGFYNDDATTAGAIAGTDPVLTNRWDLEDATGTDASIFGFSGISTGIAPGVRGHTTTSMTDAISTGVLFGLVLPELEQNLISHWTLDEASGTRVDSCLAFANDLTDNNTVTQAAGKVGNAGQFKLANVEALSRVDNASLSMGTGVRMTVAAWVYADSFTSGSDGAHMIIGKRDENVGSLEWYLRAINATAKFNLEVSPNGATPVTSVTDPIARSTDTWYFVVAWYDGVNLNIQVDMGVITSTAFTGDLFNGTADFVIGAYDGISPALRECWDGRLDLISLYKRVLTDNERAQHYASGAGLAYPFTLSTNPPRPLRSLQAVKRAAIW